MRVPNIGGATASVKSRDGQTDGGTLDVVGDGHGDGIGDSRLPLRLRSLLADRPVRLAITSSDLVLLDLLAEGVPVDLEILGGPREVPAMALQHAGDEPLLELAPGVREEDSAVDHLGDECVQLLLHGVTLP